MKGGLESQASFGGRLPGPWPQEGRVASDPLAACQDPGPWGLRTLCPLLRLSVLSPSGHRAWGPCVCVCACSGE